MRRNARAKGPHLCSATPANCEKMTNFAVARIRVGSNPFRVSSCDTPSRVKRWMTEGGFAWCHRVPNSRAMALRRSHVSIASTVPRSVASEAALTATSGRAMCSRTWKKVTTLGRTASRAGSIDENTVCPSVSSNAAGEFRDFDSGCLPLLSLRLRKGVTRRATDVHQPHWLRWRHTRNQGQAGIGVPLVKLAVSS